MTSPIQFSDKMGDAILVVGGADADEFATNLGRVLGNENAQYIVDKFREKYESAMSRPGNVHTAAVATAKTGFPATEASSVSPQGASVSAIPQCQHGQRVEKRGVTKAGKQYHGWMCNQAQYAPDKCDPIWM